MIRRLIFFALGVMAFHPFAGRYVVWEALELVASRGPAHHAARFSPPRQERPVDYSGPGARLWRAGIP